MTPTDAMRAVLVGGLVLAFATLLGISALLAVLRDRPCKCDECRKVRQLKAGGR